MTKLHSLAVTVFLASTLIPSNAFTIQTFQHRSSANALTFTKSLSNSGASLKSRTIPGKSTLFAESEDSSEGQDVEEEEAASEDSSSDSESPNPPSAQNEEIAAIKAQIAELENTLKNKNRELNSLQNMADQYSEGGYARKVAEMESFRRNKRAASADNKTVAQAVVLTDFLPIMEELNALVAKHEGDEFAQKYRALSGDFNKALGDMGVEGFTINEGAAVDGVRCVAVEKEFSDTVPKDCVVRVSAFGYELEGNIMRPVNAVVSKGPQAVAASE